ERDTLSLMVFNNTVVWKEKDVTTDRAGKEKLQGQIKRLIAQGQTALYDAIAQASEYLDEKPQADRISAVGCLTDGEDNKSKLTLDRLKAKIKFDPEKRPTRVFTICYGSSLKKPSDEELRLRKVLEGISEATRARSYNADPKNVRQVFMDVSTFF